MRTRANRRTSTRQKRAAGNAGDAASFANRRVHAVKASTVLTFRHRLTWADVDYARVAYYLRYFVWVDDAFHGYLFEHGFHIKEFMEQGYGLPYLSSSCRYFLALTLEDEVEIQLTLTNLDEKGFTLRYRIVKADNAAVAAEGEIVRRCIQREPPRSMAMPQALRESLRAIAES